jgi:hypothetical protein
MIPTLIIALLSYALFTVHCSPQRLSPTTFLRWG